MKRQIDITRQSGIHPATISNILNGRRRPSWDMAKRLIQAVPGTTIELWMEGTPDQIREAIRGVRQPEQTEHQNEVAA